MDLLVRGYLRLRDWHTDDESGQGLAEYALILALVAIVCVAGLSQLGLAIVDTAGFVTLPTAL